MSGLDQLRELDLSSTSVSGDELFQLSHLPITRFRLASIIMSFNHNNLKQLHDFRCLQYLDLSYTMTKTSEGAHADIDRAEEGVQSIQSLVEAVRSSLLVLVITFWVSDDFCASIRELNPKLKVIKLKYQSEHPF